MKDDMETLTVHNTFTQAVNEAFTVNDEVRLCKAEYTLNRG